MRLAIFPLLLASWSALAQSEPGFRRLPSNGPAPTGRIDGVIAYDLHTQRIFLFGGQDASNRNDLWAYSLDRQEWTELQPAGGARPVPRFGHTLVYDPVRRRVILFGGQASGFFSDVWAYDVAANSWRQLAPDNAGPSKRYGHSAVYDAPRDRMIVSHGFTDSGRFDDTWAFSFPSNTWQNISPPGARPLKRCLHHAVIDEQNNQMLLYGGCSSGAGPCPQADLWSFDLTAHRWTERTPSQSPPGREWYGMAFDSKRGRLVMFGGAGNAGTLDDTWEWEPGANRWTQLQPAGERPDGRSRHEATYVSDLGLSVFFGGRSNSGLSNELWAFGPPPVSTTRPQIAPGGVRNSFSGAAGGVSPGELVSIFGANLGPAEGIATSFDSNGVLPVTAGGVTVTFNGAPAPLLFVRGDQINVQAPPDLSGRAVADIVVSKQGASSPVENVPVAAAHPGLFPRAFNQDATLNSAGNPAEPGSILVLFATGVAPAQPTLRIGGRVAELLFAGPIPQTVGLIQINARIPEGTPSGEVSIVLASAGVDSAPITVALR